MVQYERTDIHWKSSLGMLTWRVRMTTSFTVPATLSFKNWRTIKLPVFPAPTMAKFLCPDMCDALYGKMNYHLYHSSQGTELSHFSQLCLSQLFTDSRPIIGQVLVVNHHQTQRLFGLGLRNVGANMWTESLGCYSWVMHTLIYSVVAIPSISPSGPKYTKKVMRPEPLSWI